MTYDKQQKQNLHKFLKEKHSFCEYKRASALLALSKGKKRIEVAEIFEVNIATLDRWQTSFKRFGISGISNKEYPGNHRKLTKEQKINIKQTVSDKNPSDLGLSDKRFWTVRLLKQLIQKEFGVVFESEATYRKLFYSFGFSCHKPGKHNRNQRAAEVKRFRVKVKKRSGNTRGFAAWYW